MTEERKHPAPPLFVQEIDRAKGLHPTEQWFSIMIRSRHVPAVKGGSVVVLRLPHFERANEPAHTWHPDSFTGDASTRRAHHAERRKTGVIVTACGKKFDPGDLLIESDRDPSERCTECAKAIEPHLPKKIEEKKPPVADPKLGTPLSKGNIP